MAAVDAPDARQDIRIGPVDDDEKSANCEFGAVDQPVFMGVVSRSSQSR